MINDLTQENVRPIRRIQRDDKPRYVETNGIKRHELSLLELLIEAHPERAKLIIERICLQKRVA